MTVALHHSLARTLWAMSDVRALHAMHLAHPEVVTGEEWASIEAVFQYAMHGPDAYAAAPRHQWGGRPMSDAEAELQAQISAPRWRLIDDYILSRIPAADVRRAMDFGTWIGAHAWALSLRFPEAVVFARDIIADIAPVVQAMSRGRNVVFEVGDYRNLPQDLDLLFAGEVLEHIWEWEAAVAAFEQACRPGARIILTMPIGMWEPEAPERQHLMQWDTATCEDVFGQKAGFQVTTLAVTVRNLFRGWNIVEFRAQSGPTGSVDYAARFKLWGLE